MKHKFLITTIICLVVFLFCSTALVIQRLCIERRIIVLEQLYCGHTYFTISRIEGVCVENDNNIMEIDFVCDNCGKKISVYLNLKVPDVWKEQDGHTYRLKEKK